MKKIHYLCSGEAVKDDSELSDHECWEQKKRATYHKPHVSTQQTNNLNFKQLCVKQTSRFTHCHFICSIG
jgi:hypothetical protein